MMIERELSLQHAHMDTETGMAIKMFQFRTTILTIMNYKVTYLNSTMHAMFGWLNRDGLLCSKCKDGYSPLVNSYDLNCIKSTNSSYDWLKFIAVAFILLAIFYFIVISFRINATNPYLYMDSLLSIKWPQHQ